jgi:hypothetical protein
MMGDHGWIELIILALDAVFKIGPANLILVGTIL